MAASDKRDFNPDELRELLQAADSSALLVIPRLLRRVIKRHRKLTGIGLEVPHRKSYVIGRDALLALTSRAELGVGPQRELSATVLLIAAPDPAKLAAIPRGPALVKYWRLLFHARIHQAIGDRIADGRLTESAIRERIHRIGQTEFNEIRTVLRQEKYLLPPRDDPAVYEEFAALYLDLSWFAASLLPRFFPGIEDLSRIDRLLAEDVDAPALFAATRLTGAPDPVAAVDLPDSPEAAGAEALASTPPAVSGQQAADLNARADRAAAAGNLVRAAIRRFQSAAESKALAELDRLVERLRSVLHLDDAASDAWRQAMPALLPGAAAGTWPAEARLLYDLQTVCRDAERPLLEPDLLHWARSGGRESFMRSLPDLPLVRMVKRLRRAFHRLPAARITQPQRHALSSLLHQALHHAEGRLRDRLRPLLTDVLDQVGLKPQNFPERVAQAKLVEELLDQLVERGFLKMADLRDALSRNQLKLPDLAGPREFLGGDPLLRTDQGMAGRAAGLYRRGEVYLRWLQRGTALAFATRLGRWITLFLALPLGGAFATVVFVQEMLSLVHLPHHLEPAALAMIVAILGVFYALLLHLPGVRRIVTNGLRRAWGAARTVLIDLPFAFLRLPPVRALLASRPVLFFVRYGLKPLPATALATGGLWAAGLRPAGVILGGCVTHLAVSLFLNSRPGRDLEEALADWLARRWEFWRGFLPGLFRLVMDTFQRLLEQVDRVLYAVDEWFRFRGGESRLTLAAKIVLGLVWSMLAYIVRLYVNVFIEPTFNPVKHFPAVTVAAKLLVPFWLPLTEFLAAPLMFLGAPLAYGIAFLNLHALPGAAGFLVWELTAGWRLYRANRPTMLQPVAIGHHGETMLRLLRPGFHSGTLPKLYARLRRAERRAHRNGDWKAARQLREALHHVEASIRHFGERELVVFLNESKSWTAGRVQLAAVEAGSNRVRLELACPALGEPHLLLRFEEQSGWLLAHVSQPGWLARLSGEQAAVLATALIGFYKKAGVDLVREQIAALLEPICPPYDIADTGLVLWPGEGYETEVLYDLSAGPLLYPRVVRGRKATEMPVLAAAQLLFRDQPVAWTDWVAAWELGERTGPLLAGMQVLPRQ